MSVASKMAYINSERTNAGLPTLDQLAQQKTQTVAPSVPTSIAKVTTPAPTSGGLVSSAAPRTTSAPTATASAAPSTSTGGITSDWVQKNLYNGILGRSGSSDETGYWANAANQWGLTTDQLSSAFSQSAIENLAKLGTDEEREQLAPRIYDPLKNEQKQPIIIQKQDWAGLIGNLAKPSNAMRSITPQETVSWQLNNILNENSPLMQSARSSALAQANDRGLINSNLAIQSGQKAVIDTAAPIAAQDASTYAASGLSAQNANQDINQISYKAQIDSVLKAQELYNAAVLQEQQGGITQETTAQKYALETELQKALKEIDINLDVEKIASNDRQAFINATGNLMQQYQVAYTGIMQQPDSSLDAASKASAVADLQSMLKSQLNSIANVYNYQVDWGLEAAKAGSGSNDYGSSYMGYLPVPGKPGYFYVNGKEVSQEMIGSGVNLGRIY